MTRLEKVNWESIGLTQEELQNRVVDKLCETILAGGIETEAGFLDQINAQIRKCVVQTINDLAETHVLPNVQSYIESLTLMETNRWGEKTGQALTFIEYLVRKANEYLLEKVNYEGKSKEESSYSSWSGTQTRITHMIHKHLHYSIETAMKTAMANANGAIVQGIEQTVKIKLQELSNKLKMSVEVK